MEKKEEKFQDNVVNNFEIHSKLPVKKLSFERKRSYFEINTAKLTDK